MNLIALIKYNHPVIMLIIIFSYGCNQKWCRSVTCSIMISSHKGKSATFVSLSDTEGQELVLSNYIYIYVRKKFLTAFTFCCHIYHFFIRATKRLNNPAAIKIKIFNLKVNLFLVLVFVTIPLKVIFSNVTNIWQALFGKHFMQFCQSP